MKCTVYDEDRAHVFRSWSAQKRVDPVVVEGGSGAWFWDNQGIKYLDFCSQRVNLNLGHQHPRLISRIKDQADKLATLSQIHASAAKSEAARLIAERTPGDLDKIFFTNSGTEAVEHAIRMAKIHTGRNKVLTMYRSYHGSTAGSMSYTGEPRRWAIEPGVPGAVKFIGPYLYRSSFSSNTESEESARALAHLEEIVNFEGPQNIAAIMIESIVGTNGILIPPDGYLQGIRDLCNKHQIVMICDEVMSGFGRCGEWFAVNKWQVVPDLITFAKGVNSGYVPLGGVAVSPEIYRSFEELSFPGGGTYFGHPLACATAAESIHIFEDEQIIERVRRLGDEIIGPGLLNLYEKHPSIGEVRGTGCFWALELVKSRKSREMLVPFNAKGQQAAPMKELKDALLKQGLWVLTHHNRLHICPPLITDDADIELGLEIIDKSLTVVDKHVEQG